MARLPQVGGDDSSWGVVLNDFLGQAHNGDGTLKNNAVGSSQIALNAVTNGHIANTSVDKTKLSSAVQTSLDKADSQTAVKLQSTAVALGAPGDGQALVYSASASAWTPATISSTTVSDATSSAKGIVQLAGDLTGTSAAPTLASGAVTSAKIADGTIVSADISATAAIAKSQLASTVQTSLDKADSQVAIKLQNTAVSSTGPGDGQALVYVASTTAWVPTTLTQTAPSDASTSTKGVIQLAGDLAGTAVAPVVAVAAITTAKINDAAVTTAKIVDSAVTSAKIADATIVSADISATAAIAKSQLATAVQTSLDKADAAIDKPTAQGIALVQTLIYGA